MLCASTWEIPEILGTLAPHPLIWEHRWLPKTGSFSSVLPYHIWSLYAKTMGVSRGPKNLGYARPRPFRLGVSDPWKHAPSHKCYHRKLVRSRSNGWCEITKILQKSLTLRAPPFRVTRGQWNRQGLIGDLWLSISVLVFLPSVDVMPRECKNYKKNVTNRVQWWVCTTREQ